MKQTIQFLNFDQQFRKKNFEKENIKINSLSEPETLNKFEINIINLNDPNLWMSKKYEYKDYMSINQEADLNHLSGMIKSAKNTKIIIIFPQALNFKYYYQKTSARKYEYTQRIRLKDKPLLYINVVRQLLPNFLNNLVFEPDETFIKNEITLKSDFYLSGVENNKIITKAAHNEKPTTIELKNNQENTQLLVTTLDLKEYLEILTYLINIGLMKAEKSPAPEWINEIKILNDNDLHEEIEKIDDQIESLIEQKDENNKQLEKNNQYKEVLYENGVNLEEIVISFLEEMLDTDHSDFVDLKKEDFLMKLEDIKFIGEIKGYNRNLRDGDVFQLLGHASEYFHRLKDEGENIEREKIKPLLIVNHQRNNPIDERIEIHQNQIEKAARDDMLIITTVKLLELFEEFKQEKITTPEIIKLLSEETGLLE